MRILSLSFLCLWLFPPAAIGAKLSGTVLNGETSDPLVSANIYIDGTMYGTYSDDDGQFTIENVPAGRYTLTASHVGYAVYKRRVVITEDLLGGYDSLIGISRAVIIKLYPEVLHGQTVVVTATRAKDRETPVTFSNLTKEDIRQRYYAQDVPMVLQTMPSAYAYSDAGNGVGYSYLKIRGFNQMRINVLINGIPHNGPTSHEVYWIDLPDFLESAEDIQVQRGVGSSLYGSSAFGGTVNIITTRYSSQPEVSGYVGMGSYNTHKYSFKFNSGLVNDSYVMYGRFSRVTSDGYRDQSWTKLWSYFLGVARHDPTMTTKFQVYGGPEQTHLAYYGVDSTYIHGRVTGDARKDRRYNPLTYEDELDNFHQPHYELHHDWQLSDQVKLSNSLYTILGRGDYSQFRTRRSLQEFRLPNLTVQDPLAYPTPWYERDDEGNPAADSQGNYTITRSDLVRSRWVDNEEYGWLPRVSWSHRSGTLTFGGELRSHRGKHWGMITWLAATPLGISPDHVYYSYVEKKLTTSAYLHEVFHLTSRITLVADLQIVNHRYTLEQDTVTHYAYETNFRWLAPKAGINVNLTDQVHIFGNVAYTKREPTTTNLLDPQDYWAEPNFRVRRTDTAQENRFGVTQLTDPTVEPERMINYELGVGWRSPLFAAMVNLYHMDFRNEIVPWTGEISEASGLPVTGNADRSVHQGLEFEAIVRPASFMELSANLNVNNDHLEKYTENVMDWNTMQVVSIPRDGSRIAGFPTALVNFHCRAFWHGFNASVAVRYIGRQYLDNSQNDRRSIAPYTITDASIGYRIEQQFGLKGLELRLLINNVFDKTYEAAGYMDDIYADAISGKVYGTPYTFPQQLETGS